MVNRIFMRYFLLIFFVLLSCSRTSVTEKEVERLKKEVILEKSAESFFWLESHYESSNHTEEIMPYSLIMTKDSSKSGCYNFYKQYLKILNNGKFDRKNFYNLDKEERKFLIYILNKGALNEDEYCQDELFFYYNDKYGKEKNKYKADSLFKILPTTKAMKLQSKYNRKPIK